MLFRSSTLHPDDGGWANTIAKYVPYSDIPVMICLGNHDITDNAGNGVMFDSNEDMDNALIIPYQSIIDWDNKGNGSYYYKDFIKDAYKYRVIVLNDYERPRLVADGSWETISYNSSYSAYNSSASYQSGDKVNLNGHSYQAVKSVSGVAPTRTYFDYQDGRYISEEQSLWLCNALNSMPDGYNAIICSHMKICDVTKVDGKFTYRGSGTGDYQMCQDGYVVADIIKAFTERSVLEKTYNLTKRVSNAVNGEIINGFGYTLSYDFSNAASPTSKIKMCCTGHTHYDQVAKINNLGFDLLDITMCTGSQTFQTGDTVNFGERSKDAFNIVSVDNNTGIKVLRIGQDINDKFELRDNIILNY